MPIVNSQELEASFVHQLNDWGKRRIPFLFVIDFEMKHPFACRTDKASEENIFYDLQGVSNFDAKRDVAAAEIIASPVPFAVYEEKFNYVAERLHYGDSFLTNLTIRTPIQSSSGLDQLLHQAKAKYRLLFRDEFLVFSPETFVRIKDGKISTNPMKGTIDASVDNAESVLLNDKKELAEHITIVDLLRNDLSSVSSEVTVNRFRYLEKVTTTKKNLWQMSSEITGNLPDGYEGFIGDILSMLLPAGSVTGAPKARTQEIISEAEQEPRGFYTGVFGYFNGEEMDSAVMIRFIEKEGDKLYYRSGGGITAQSNALSEYQEAIDKIYVPIS